MRQFIASVLRKILHPIEHLLTPLDERSANPDPIRQFQQWFDEAVKAKFYLPESMALATASKDGTPSARMVLLKHVDSRGFVFYTNFNSRKAKDLADNSRACALFHWAEMHCQVRVEGTIEKVSDDESDKYFNTRARESQLGAIASPQSDVIGSREELDQHYAEAAKRYSGMPVPRPAHWGGYRLRPTSIEFWQGRFARLHDRILYTLQPDGRWKISRLAP